MTTTEWAHLHNAALIDMLLADFSRATPTKIEKLRAVDAAWAAARGAARAAAWAAARDDAWAAAWGAGWAAAGGAARAAARGAAWAAARGAAWDAAWGAVWAAAGDAAWLSASALVAWDDMPAFIALGTEELEALRLLGAGTDIAHKALCALYYKEITS